METISLDRGLGPLYRRVDRRDHRLCLQLGRKQPTYSCLVPPTPESDPSNPQHSFAWSGFIAANFDIHNIRNSPLGSSQFCKWDIAVGILGIE